MGWVNDREFPYLLRQSGLMRYLSHWLQRRLPLLLTCKWGWLIEAEEFLGSELLLEIKLLSVPSAPYKLGDHAAIESLCFSRREQCLNLDIPILIEAHEPVSLAIPMLALYRFL